VGVELAGETPELERGWPDRKRGISTVYRLGDTRWAVYSSDEPLRSSLRRGIGRGAVLALGSDTVAHRIDDDPALVALREALDPRRSAQRLIGWLGPAPEGPELRVLSYKPLRRCVVAYDGGALLGKLFAGDRDREALLRHRALAAAEGPAPPLEVPDPAGCVSSWSMLLWRRAPGESLTERLAKPEAARDVAAVGAGLAMLQARKTAWPGTHGLESELAVLSRWTRVAAATRPALAERCRTTLAHLERLGRTLSAPPSVPAHRDFHDGQLLVDGGRLRLLDLDTASRAAPELDPGNFLAHLRLRQLQGLAPDAERLARGFLDGYRERAEPPHPDRLRWYTASALLRLACVYALRPCWSHASASLADEALDTPALF